MTNYNAQAAEFLNRNGLRLRITLSNSKPANWEPAGNHYRVTISSKNRGRITFDFWGSLNDASKGIDPSVYDVLACISSDVYIPDEFGDFCAEFGYDEDSIKAQQTFRRSDRFAKRLREFLTSAEIEQLSEIR